MENQNKRIEMNEEDIIPNAEVYKALQEKILNPAQADAEATIALMKTSLDTAVMIMVANHEQTQGIVIGNADTLAKAITSILMQKGNEQMAIKVASAVMKNPMIGLAAMLGSMKGRSDNPLAMLEDALGDKEKDSFMESQNELADSANAPMEMSGKLDAKDLEKNAEELASASSILGGPTAEA